MGFALAKVAADEGAEVILISGPVNIDIKHPNIKLIKTESADEMYSQALNYFKQSNIAIFAAAVADYKPEKMHSKKVKKSQEFMQLKLIQNRDIAYELGKIKKEDQLTVGFALETNNETENAQKKIKKKKFDLIILNSLQDKGAGFGYDTNKISILDKYNNIERFELKSKIDVAKDIINKVIETIHT
jgi:phosphopantothenoylcysteine decarboxylase/phosphopantothenate--cysteine ligase